MEGLSSAGFCIHKETIKLRQCERCKGDNKEEEVDLPELADGSDEEGVENETYEAKVSRKEEKKRQEREAQRQGVRADGNFELSNETGKQLSVKSVAAGLRFSLSLSNPHSFHTDTGLLDFVHFA